jgi:hypothetical protein
MSGLEADHVLVWDQTCSMLSNLGVSRPQAGYVQQRKQTCLGLLVRNGFGNPIKFDYQKIWHIG